jgi:hypothetical protein
VHDERVGRLRRSRPGLSPPLPLGARRQGLPPLEECQGRRAARHGTHHARPRQAQADLRSGPAPAGRRPDHDSAVLTGPALRDAEEREGLPAAPDRLYGLRFASLES